MSMGIPSSKVEILLLLFTLFYKINQQTKVETIDFLMPMKKDPIRNK